MTNLDKLLKEFKEAEKKCADSFGLSEIANYEYEAFSVNNSAKLIRIIEVMMECLDGIAKENISGSNIYGAAEAMKICANEALQQAEKIAGEHE